MLATRVKSSIKGLHNRGVCPSTSDYKIVALSALNHASLNLSHFLGPD